MSFIEITLGSKEKKNRNFVALNSEMSSKIILLTFTVEQRPPFFTRQSAKVKSFQEKCCGEKKRKDEKWKHYYCGTRMCSLVSQSAITSLNLNFIDISKLCCLVSDKTNLIYIYINNLGI